LTPGGGGGRIDPSSGRRRRAIERETDETLFPALLGLLAEEGIDVEAETAAGDG